MASKSKYTQEQIAAAVAQRRSSFGEFMQVIMAEQSHDLRFRYYVDNLLLVIYEHHLDGKFITKTQACRLIPIGHSNTCKKYVEEAEKRGFLRFERDKKDERRLNVVPTSHLLNYVQGQMESEIDKARDLIGDVVQVEALPKDNLPLSGLSKR